MVSSREMCLFCKKNTAFWADCKENGSKITPSAALRSAAPPRGRLWAVPQGLPLPQSRPLGEGGIAAGDDGRGKFSVASPQKGAPERLQALRCPEVQLMLLPEDQIRLSASSSPTSTKSGCICRMLAGTSGVTGPKKAFLTISALAAPLTTSSTLRACMMVRMPMV